MKYNLHTHTYRPEADVIQLVNQYPYEYTSDLPCSSLGIHPWYIDETTWRDELDIIVKNIHKTNVWAIGECGLDKRIKNDFSLQEKIFKEQLFLAETYKKPVVLHCVAAYQEVIAIKKELQLTIPMIVHGFSKNWQVANSLLQQGFYLSFGKYLLRNADLAEVFKKGRPHTNHHSEKGCEVSHVRRACAEAQRYLYCTF